MRALNKPVRLNLTKVAGLCALVAGLGGVHVGDAMGAVAAPKGAIVSIGRFHAVGNGSTDDTAAIQAALDSLRPGDTLLFATGKTYRYSNVLNVHTSGVTLAGKATLYAVNEQASALHIVANDVTVRGGLVLRMGPTTQRFDAPTQSMIFLDGHSGARIEHVTVNGSPSAGILVMGASKYVISDATVENTRADGIHNTDGAHDGQIIRPVIRNTGDDGVAVVSYQKDGSACHDISITSPRFYGNTHGRGFSVVGGRDITFTDVYARNSDAAAIYIGTESFPYFTYSVRNVKVLGGTLVGSNTDSSIAHGAILLLAARSGFSEKNIDIENVTISNTRSSAPWQVGMLSQGGTFSRIVLRNITMKGGPGNPFGTNVGDRTVYDGVNWTFNGQKLPDRIGFTPVPGT